MLCLGRQGVQGVYIAYVVVVDDLFCNGVADGSRLPELTPATKQQKLYRTNRIIIIFDMVSSYANSRLI
jgi:hypothetical protein